MGLANDLEEQAQVTRQRSAEAHALSIRLTSQSRASQRAAEALAKLADNLEAMARKARGEDITKPDITKP